MLEEKEVRTKQERKWRLIQVSKILLPMSSAALEGWPRESMALEDREPKAYMCHTGVRPLSICQKIRFIGRYPGNTVFEDS